MAEGLQKLVPFFSEPGKKKKRQNENKKKNIGMMINIYLLNNF